MEIDYQAAGFWLSTAAFLLSLVASVCAVVVWFGSRGRVTQAAIDRVESVTRELHGGQESRIVRMEEALRHALTAQHLRDELGPLYEIVRRTEQREAALTSDLASLRENIRNELQGVRTDLRALTDKILERGLNK